MNYQIQGLSIHAEVHGTTDPACSPGRRATTGSGLTNEAPLQVNNHGVFKADEQRGCCFHLGFVGVCSAPPSLLLRIRILRMPRRSAPTLL